MNGLNIFFMTAIFIAVFSWFSSCFAQEYNNWLFHRGVVLNFNTSPATIICSNHNVGNYAIALSDDNGDIILTAYKEISGGSTSMSNFIIKDFNNQNIISIECSLIKNVIGAKLPNGGYCIAAVFGDLFKINLYVYMFDANGKLEKEYVYKDANYSFFLDFIRFDDYIVLVAYRKSLIETYKLTSDGCYLWKTSDIELDEFLNPVLPVYFTIGHSLDNTKIIAVTHNIVYVLNFDKNSCKFSVAYRFETDKFIPMSFSKTDKYFLIIDDDKLKGFRYDESFDFNFENPEIVYDLPKRDYDGYNNVWSMALGVDDKLYVCNYKTNYVVVLDGIETGNITQEIIKSDCLIFAGHFPGIPRYKDYQTCTARVEFDNTSVCNAAALKMTLSGTAPFEVFYTLNGEEKSFKTLEKEYVLETVPGKYRITRTKDARCEFSPQKHNEIEILPEVKRPKIIEKN
ncbi:MAG: hypothetical protein II937_15395 [Bacteroidales bacterium]|nr:hypothetical protein [Bacteroidales bacterium]